MSLAERAETTDGSRAHARALSDAVCLAHPLVAFAVLRGGGDAFAGGDAQLHTDAAREAVTHTLHVRGGSPGERAQVVDVVVRMLQHNRSLAARVAAMKAIDVDIVRPTHAGGRLSDAGFPPTMNERAAGVFWDDPWWPRAKIGLRSEHLDADPILVVHEMAHALHRLAFGSEEQALIDAALMPVWGRSTAIDEVFAIYSEAEFLPAFSRAALATQGVYGATRRQWSDDHLFTRFVRKLYFPHRPPAGDKVEKARAWRQFSGS